MEDENTIPEKFKRPLFIDNFSISVVGNCICMSIETNCVYFDKAEIRQIVEYLKNHI
jgi:hypothetical protein